ncbi:MAG TPA: stress response translation initiation inhibitor YciH [Candidatus Diapherotrites archaeon]|uniref:Protein translation factor SUI1 homolog n=1 Tax=Candidatus Iainarchaeum sp. TaxID=3101447 RepID=A0A7J4IZE3_9ARCH|nr:stress response translation initiation inhibitor YciH [Candidatus Diapherotrites archaeon]
MAEIDKITGLPKDLLDFGEITKESQKIRIRMVARRFGKFVTVVSGFENEEEAKRLGKEMKRKLACGGTTKGKEIELQGRHQEAVKAILLREGYKEELIDA